MKPLTILCLIALSGCAQFSRDQACAQQLPNPYTVIGPLMHFHDNWQHAVDKYAGGNESTYEKNYSTYFAQCQSMTTAQR